MESGQTSPMEELIDEALRFLKSVVERANEVPEQNGLDVPTLLKLAWEKAEEELGPALRKEREAAARAKREAEEKAAIAEAAKKKVKAWTEKKEKDDQRAAEAAARAAAEREAKEEAARKKEEVAAAREMARRAQAAAKEAIEARKAEEAQRIADASEAAELARQHEEQATDAAAAADGFVVPTFSHAESANGPPPRSDENQLMGEQPMEELEKSKVGTGEVVATPASRAVHVTVGTVPSDVANKQVKRKSAEDEAEEEASAQHELGRQAKPTSSASSAAAARLERSHRRLSAFNMLPRFGKSGSEAQHSEQGDADGSQLVEAPEQAKERPKRPTLLDWLPDPHRTQLSEAWVGGASLSKEMECGIAWPPEGAFAFADCLVADEADDCLVCFGSDGDPTTVSTYSTRGSDWGMFGHEESVCSLAMNGELIASGSLDGSIRLWDRSTGECLAVLEACRGLPLGLAMTERLLMSGEEPSPEEVDAIAAPPAPSRARREDDEDADEDGKGAQDGDGGSGDDESLVADASQVSCNGRAHLWRLPEIIAGESGAEQPAAEYMEHTAAVCSVALGETLAVSAGSVDCTARVWPLSRRGRTASVAVLRHPAAVFSVSVNFASTLAATGCADGNVWLWSLTTWELYQQDAEITPVRILDHTGMDSVSPVSCVRLINDMLVSGGQDGHVKVWSVASATGECITTIHKALGDSLDGSDTVECVQAVAASAFGYVAVAGGNKLVIWRPKNAPPPPPPPPKQPPVKRRASLFSGVKR